MVTTQAKPPLRIMLVDDDPKRAGWVEQCLNGMGFDTCAVVGNAMRVLKVITEVAPDVIIIDMDSPGRDILESLTILAAHQPTPVVMFSDEEDPDFIRRAVDAGVSTYLVGGIDPVKVEPIIEIAMAQFRSFQQLKTALDETRLELSERHTVDKAKRILMRSHDLSEARAFAYLRGQAMDCGARIADIAQRVIKLSESGGIEN